MDKDTREMEIVKKNTRLQISGNLLVRNTLFNLVGQVAPLLVGVITIPFVVRGLGTERFGLLSLAWVVLGYFTIFDLGLGRATTKFVAEALGKGETDQVPHLVWTSVTIQAILGILGATVLVGVTPFLVGRILKIPPALVNEAKVTFYLLSLSVPVVLVSTSFRGVLEAAQRFDLVNAVKIPISGLTFLLPLVGLFLGFRLPGIVALILAARMGALMAFFAMDLRVIPHLKKYANSFALFPSLFSFGGWVTISSIIGPIFTYLERFLIASFLSVGILTFYAVPYDIISRVVIIPTSMFMVLFPTFSHVVSVNYKAARELFARPFTYLLFVMVPILIVGVVFADEILKLWLGSEFSQKSTTVFQVLTIVFFFHAFAYLPFAAIQGAGRPDLKAKLDLLMLPIFVGLCWWLIPELGLLGVALAKLLVTLIDLLCLSWMAKRLFGFSIKEMLGERVEKALVMAISFTLVALSFRRILLKPTMVDIIVIGAFVFAYLFMFVKTVMDDKDKATIRNVLKSFLLRRT
ncbi:O13/O129/O135 family O-antigen flippase [Atrimonas thermophila]